MEQEYEYRTLTLSLARFDSRLVAARDFVRPYVG